MFLSSETLYMSLNMDTTAVPMSLSSYATLRQKRFRYLVPNVHCCSNLEVSFLYLGKCLWKVLSLSFYLKYRKRLYILVLLTSFETTEICINFKCSYNDKVKWSVFPRKNFSIRLAGIVVSAQVNFPSHLPTLLCCSPKKLPPNRIALVASSNRLLLILFVIWRISKGSSDSIWITTWLLLVRELRSICIDCFY